MSAPLETIGGRVYSFGMMPPTAAVRVEVAIGSVIGEGLFKMIVQGVGKGPEQQAAISAAIGLMVSKMDADTLIATMGLVFQYVTVDGARIASIDSSFQGRNKELWLAFVAALKVNFADFFPASLIASVKSNLPAV